MNLQREISSVVAKMSTAMPDETRQVLTGAKTSFEQSFDRTTAIQPGQHLPEFQLPNAVGEPVSSAALLSTGPLLMTFYRGSWCPFCDLALRALQKHLPEFKARGVALVAITPELPDFSLSLTEKHNLEFHVLTDAGNKYAEKLGLLYSMPDSLRPVYEGAAKDLSVHNGNDEFSVPVPATILVGTDGVVRQAFVDPDYMKRAEPAVVLGWIDALEE
ncbi:redoxin domain-containing protein [Aspergillus pseudoustus]|uniref:thioredoxin-dependent peroxiredoxin n=1 Tax=Aspergillus pseudoustus TaxID=1810923 RepID=A0ABR4IX31_9EURO